MPCLFYRTIQEYSMAYPWAYLFTLKSYLRHCRLLSRKKKILSRPQQKFVGHSCVWYYTEKQNNISIRIYILGGSSFSGKRSCAHNMQEVGSQTPGRVVVRLSMCSNVFFFVKKVDRWRVEEKELLLWPEYLKMNP